MKPLEKTKIRPVPRLEIISVSVQIKVYYGVILPTPLLLIKEYLKEKYK